MTLAGVGAVKSSSGAMEPNTILDFIRRHKLMVLSTCRDNHWPQAAVVGFGETANLELIFGTDKLSRKYRNLKANGKVALVIGWDENITVQYEGIAEELTADNAKTYKDIYFAKNPQARKWDSEGNAYFRITPTWIRFSDLNKHPSEIIEMAF